MTNGSRYIDPEKLDPAKRAEMGISSAAEDVEIGEDILILDKKLKERQAAEKTERKKAEEAARVVRAEEERKATPIAGVTSSRDRARLLVLTRDASVFDLNSAAQRHIIELSGMFAEVHVIVLLNKQLHLPESQRIGDYVWAYPAYAKWWLATAWSARSVAKKQLRFGGGFRADIIIANDPFEVGLAGYMISRKYDRPFQVHIAGDFLEAGFKKKDAHNSWRLHIANFILRRTACVRTKSEYMRRRILERYRLPEGAVEIMPVYHNLEEWRQLPPTVSLAERYPQFKFILFHVSSMDRLSHTAAVIDGLFYMLRQYPTIGLVIAGDGPEKSALQKRVEEYGLTNQIRFEPISVDVLSYIKTAQVLIHTSEETSLDYVVLQAAAVETPMVCGGHGLAAELFLDDESVLLCPVDSPPCLGEKVNQLLNNNALRKKLAMNAKDEVFKRTLQDRASYVEAYRASIERCLLLSSGEQKR